MKYLYSYLKIVVTLILTYFLFSSITFAQSHFITVWTGNGYNQMNIFITGVDVIGGGSLIAGDEIGIFDGENCVGAAVISGPIDPLDPLSIKASTDDPVTPEVDGFINGHTISYKFWLSATSEEITDYIANYESGFDDIFESFGATLLYFTNVLPVELVSFTADVTDSEVQLIWHTATELNNYGFEIEKCLSSPTEYWEILGFVEGNGNSSSPKFYSYTDENVISGCKYLYRLNQIDTDGSYEYSSVIEVEVTTPSEFKLKQNYPNPFNPNTTIRYQLPKESKVVIKIYDILGVEVITLLDEKKEPGVYEVELNVQSLSSGTYIYRIVAGEFVETKKMVLVK